jgi:hypothetical protein
VKLVGPDLAENDVEVLPTVPVTVAPGSVIFSYDDLVSFLIRRRHQLKWSQLELDHRAGFQSGYTGKLEAWRSPGGRTAGSVTMVLWMQALGVALVPIEARSVERVKRAKPLPRLLTSLDHRRRIPAG